jgi:hypothetical protein
VGALTIGLVRVGRLTIRRADVRDLRVARLEIGELVRATDPHPGTAGPTP